MRLSVDYEMSGKDLIDSVKLSGKICRILGGQPPEGMTYELFLDQDGQKISKSKGNGLSVDEWLTYAPPESLSQFMYNKPQSAKRLYFDVIPRAVDEYVGNLDKLAAEPEPGNPAWHIHGGRLPNHAGSPISFAMLLNLASVVNADSPDILWGFIRRYAPGASPETQPLLDRLVNHAIAYYRDFVRPEKRYRQPTDMERAALEDLAATLAALPGHRPKRSRTRCSRSASATRSPTCEPGSAACTRFCSASRKDRASAASSPSTASPRRSR